MGLHESYTAIRAQILLIKPIPSITEVFSLLIQEEHQRSAGILELPSDAVALAVSDASKKAPPPDRNRKADNSGQHSGQRPICSHCGIRGHVVDRCYKLHGYPPGYKFRSSNLPETPVNSPAPKAVVAANSTASPGFFSSL